MKQITLILILLLSGCGSAPKMETWPAERFYAEAKEHLEAGDYISAIEFYEKLEARYPLGKYAQQAQLDIIYAYYKHEEPESAIVAADRFIKLYPRHSKIGYVYYLKGLVYYEYNWGSLDRFLPVEHSQRDPSAAKQALQIFSELLRRFPKSKYNQDAKQRIVYLRNMLANYELQVARFYMKRGAYIAAANRAKTIVKSYQGTQVMPDALVILAKSYKINGLNDLAAATLKVLKLNYPNHEGIAVVEKVVLK
ncbi:competence protein ComL [Candidatus Thiomargarita nelsonii]|uniref:Outer membrane protein assembly factor BamD n=1 Tax=Candidatus Thiomargarita nelsonii TaxID=1003181 RepID=A0A0A6PPJ5_9GAMM|nr:competence protein ComL [Candidatus Thiomargarita nelsonii]